ncbi:MAG TPA: MFS transporter, partial [Acetobacteraceae bacterium]
MGSASACYIAAGLAPGLATFALAQGVLIGALGTSASFAPLVADTTRWFDRRRGIALAICMSGNYTAGAVWPPVMQHFIAAFGWRHTYLGMGVFCIATMVPLAVALRRKPPVAVTAAAADVQPGALSAPQRPLGLPPNALLALLCLAGVSCCVAMAMPQVHIVAYCGDLGFGPARGAEMLSLMLAMGVVSRLVSGWISDRIGGIRTLLIGSVAQGSALLLYLFFDGLTSLYIISAMFGLFQGGIVPSYAIIVREAMPAREAATRVGIVIFASVFGMSFGGWVSGVIFDAT